MPDLTGIWSGNDGGDYFVSQVGNDIWWVGLSDGAAFHRGVTFTNVFHGRFDDAKNAYSGDWIDVPRGLSESGGSLTLSVDESASPPQLRRISEAGGFQGSSWVAATYPTFPNIRQRMDWTRRNDDGSMHDHLKMYKDYVVVFGIVADPPHIGAEFMRSEHQTYDHFICACDRWADCGEFGQDDPPDGDVNMDIQIDRTDLNHQPGFWTEGWFNDADNIRAKLDDDSIGGGDDPNPQIDGDYTNMFHCEAIIYGRNADDSNCSGVGATTLFPGWLEEGANRLLYNGRPVTVATRDPLPGGDGRVDVTLDDGPALQKYHQVRVTGFLALDCHETDCSEDDETTHNVELHPVYSIEKCQDFSQPRPGSDLSGVWHCSDVGTYYVRQAGTRVWWLGLSRDQGRAFATVFLGNIDGDTITGEAVDVPVSPDAVVSTAALTLSCVGNGAQTTELASEGPDWAGYVWRKLYDTAP